MSRPTVRQLEYLSAVGEHLSFHRAADACHVSQPGLSAQFRELETTLGVRLFERDRRRVIATAVGEALLPRARAILAAVDELVEAARGLAQPLTGTIRLGVIPTVAPFVLPRVLPDVRTRYPALRLLLREEQTATSLALLNAGRLDVVLLALEADLGDVATLPLFEDPFVLTMPVDHPLTRRRLITEADLEEQEVLLLDDGHCLRDQALAVCDRAGVHEFGDVRATSLGTLVQMVASGLGVTLLPAMALPVETERQTQLAYRRFVSPEPHRTIGLAWRRGSARAAEFHLLAKVLSSCAPAARPRSHR